MRVEVLTAMLQATQRAMDTITVIVLLDKMAFRTAERHAELGTMMEQLGVWSKLEDEKIGHLKNKLEDEQSCGCRTLITFTK